MKKSIFVFAALAVAALPLMTGCKKELKQAKGVTTAVEVHGDTLVSLTIKDGEETTKFDLSRARFNRGIALIGDSVLINYTEGRKDSLHAYIVTVLPKPTHYLKDMVDPNKPLVTAPDTATDKAKENN